MSIVIGMDLGDKSNVVVVLDKSGKEIEVARIGNTDKHIMKFFRRYPASVVVMEAGTHSAWISRLLMSLNHEVHVGNPRKMRAIWDADDKSDERDARILAYMFRLEPRLLYAISHRGEEAQRDLIIIKSRNTLVESRTQMINHCRGIVKGFGERISSCYTNCFCKRARSDLSENLVSALEEIFTIIENITKQIKEIDRKIAYLCKEKYPETKYLLQVQGVGPITALAFILTMEEPERFEKSRTVGSFLGLTPRRDQSGDIDKQLPITKAGNTYLRKLLVNCANYIMGPFGEDSDLRRYGERISLRGGKNAKKKAKVAVARKLSVLLHRLWQDKSTYEPRYRSSEKKVA